MQHTGLTSQYWLAAGVGAVLGLLFWVAVAVLLGGCASASAQGQPAASDAWSTFLYGAGTLFAAVASGLLGQWNGRRSAAASDPAAAADKTIEDALLRSIEGALKRSDETLARELQAVVHAIDRGDVTHQRELQFIGRELRWTRRRIHRTNSALTWQIGAHSVVLGKLKVHFPEWTPETDPVDLSSDDEIPPEVKP